MKKPDEYLEYLKPYQLLTDSMSNCFLKAIEQAQKDAYNQGLEDAAENVELMEEPMGGMFSQIVDKDSILKLKIK